MDIENMVAVLAEDVHPEQYTDQVGTLFGNYKRKGQLGALVECLYDETGSLLKSCLAMVDYLNVSHAVFLQGTVGKIARLFPQIQHLFLDDTNVQDEDLGHIAMYCRNVTHLTLNRTKITDAGLIYLLPMNELTHLLLVECENIRWQELAEQSFSKLKYLDLSRSPITDDSLAKFPKAPKLMLLCLTGCSEITDSGLARLPSLPKLEMLDMDGSRAHGTGLDWRRFPRLLPKKEEEEMICNH
jgi:hypothetical protein